MAKIWSVVNIIVYRKGFGHGLVLGWEFIHGLRTQTYPGKIESKDYKDHGVNLIIQGTQYITKVL